MRIKVKLRLLLTILTVIAGALAYTARPDTVASRHSVVDEIERGGALRINMPDRLRARLIPVEVVTSVVEEETDENQVTPSKPHATVSGKMGGYRIQVFSDNNTRTAKTEARARARNVSARFPQYPTYVVYNSPYWRLRVGNFRTQDEANAAAHELKEAFPDYSREIRVVKDRITLGGE